MASVAGLAPARFCLKGRARELLCIHGPSFAEATEGRPSGAELWWAGCAPLRVEWLGRQSYWGGLPSVALAKDGP